MTSLRGAWSARTPWLRLRGCRAGSGPETFLAWSPADQLRLHPAPRRPSPGRRRRLCRRCAVGRPSDLVPARASPAVRHRHAAGDFGALDRDRLLSLDGFPALRAGPAKYRLYRPAPRHLVRLHCDRRPDLSGRGRPLLPAIPLHSHSGRAVLGWSFGGSPQISAPTASSFRSPSMAARSGTLVGKS